MEKIPDYNKIETSGRREITSSMVAEAWRKTEKTFKREPLDLSGIGDWDTALTFEISKIVLRNIVDQGEKYLELRFKLPEIIWEKPIERR